MSLKNLALDVKSIALCLSEEGGYEYYHIDDDLKELAKNVSDIQAENDKLRELVRIAVKYCDSGTCDGCPILGEDESCPYSDMARELGIEVD